MLVVIVNKYGAYIDFKYNPNNIKYHILHQKKKKAYIE